MSAASEYRFVTNWDVPGTIAEVFSIIDDAESLTEWWPAVYLDVEIIDPGDSSGVGKTVRLFTKGWLPYTLRWTFRATEKVPDERIAIEAWGDFDGRGEWTFEQKDQIAAIKYEWNITAEKPLLKYCSFLIKPIFAWNHRWAMDRGLESLRLELARRRASTEAERQAVPRPPGPTWRWRR